MNVATRPFLIVIIRNLVRAESLRVDPPCVRGSRARLKLFAPARRPNVSGVRAAASIWLMRLRWPQAAAGGENSDPAKGATMRIRILLFAALAAIIAVLTACGGPSTGGTNVRGESSAAAPSNAAAGSSHHTSSHARPVAVSSGHATHRGAHAKHGGAHAKHGGT